jgi:pyruvate dehydrogenase E2 component (dihydrolipoamide acetyltransferase)
VASELGVDWKALAGTGRNGRVREADVRAARSVTSARGIPLSPRRRAIAERLRKSRERTVPVTLNTIADATNLVAWRERFRAAESEIIPAYTDMFASLLADILTRHPRMAVRWEDGRDALIPLGRDDLHVAIAVDTPDGLLAPVVRCVAGKTPVEIARESKLLIERARQGRVTPAEMQDAAITITNLGGYGIDAFTPVINYPEIAILGLGAIRFEPAVTRDGRIEPRQRITLSLTFDHAAVDGAPAAAFLRDVVMAVETHGLAPATHSPT